MKKSILSILCTLLLWPLLMAQAPNGYYDDAQNASGFALKSKLAAIISSGHRDNGYNGLHNGYRSTDVDEFYENDGTVLDMYSENPNGTDPYDFNFGNTCGDYANEGDCYNREHIIPQSLFYSNYPMRSDIHHVVPSDGKVNGYRANYPFGEVANASYTSQNGSKIGSCASSGYNGTCFEPIDEFKGDIARMVLYFVTRYENNLTSFKTNNGMLNGSRNQGLTDWELQVMLNWHAEDPVSERELDRNDAAYTYQGNRNPYIDNPDWVWEIWDPSRLNIEDAAMSKALILYPNPVVNHMIFVEGHDLNLVKELKVYNVQGQVVKALSNPFAYGDAINLQGLEAGVYFIQLDDKVEKIIIE